MRMLSKSARRSLVLVAVAAVVVVPAILVASTVPPLTTFTTGTVASATEVNANFAALRTATNDQETRLLGLEGNVAARYRTGSSQAFPTSTRTVVNFDTKDFDTHNAVTTGSGWKFTAPVAGKYRISSFVECLGTHAAGNIVQMSIGVNTQTAETVMLDAWRVYSAGYSTETSGSTTYHLNAGDYVSLTMWHNASSLLLASTASRAWIAIERIGN